MSRHFQYHTQVQLQLQMDFRDIRLVDALHGRIHGFNVSVAHVWAEQERLLVKAGQRMPVEDSYIAATARRHGLTIATGNDRDFKRPGLKVFNPFRELP